MYPYCEIWGSHSVVADDSSLLECDSESLGELYSMSHRSPSSSGSSIPRKLNIFSPVKLLLLEMSSFSGRVSGYHGSCLANMVGVQFLTSKCQQVEICNFVPGPCYFYGDMMLDAMWCRLVYPECISQKVSQLSVGVPSARSSCCKFPMVIQSGWLVLYVGCSLLCFCRCELLRWLVTVWYNRPLTLHASCRPHQQSIICSCIQNFIV
jgi:hypothetical protein